MTRLQLIVSVNYNVSSLLLYIAYALYVVM